MVATTEGPIQIIRCEGEAEWLEERKNSIGASEVADILGLGYTTPLQLYLRFKGELDWPDEQERMMIGREMEPVIASLWCRKSGRTLDPDFCWPYTIYRHEQYPYLHSTPDGRLMPTFDNAPDSEVRIIAQPAAVLELKNWSEFQRSAIEAEGPTWGHQLQNHTQMITTGCQAGVIAYLFGNQTVLGFEMAPDEHIHHTITEEAHRFWDRLDQNDPPPPQANDLATIKRLWPEHAPNKIIALDAAADTLVDNWCVAKETVKDHTSRKNKLEADLCQLMGNAEAAQLPSGRMLTLRKQTTEAYSVDTFSFRTLRLKKGNRG